MSLSVKASAAPSWVEVAVDGAKVGFEYAARRIADTCAGNRTGLAVAAGVVGIAAVSAWAKRRVPSGTVLELDLDAAEVVTHRVTGLARMTGNDAVDLNDLVRAVRAAAKDDRVGGLVVRLGNCMSLAPHLLASASLEELRDAVAAFSARGKVTVAYAETFGEASSSGVLPAYFLASAFDRVYLAPCGELMLTDALVESVFVRRALERIGVTARLRGRKKYKNIVNTLTEDSYTPEHREAVEGVVDSARRHIFAAVASARELAGGAAEFEEAVRAGPLLAQGALERRLVDGLLYRDEVLDVVAELMHRRGGGDPVPEPPKPPALYLGAYRQRAVRGGGRHRFALIRAEGTIRRGESEREWTGVETSIGSDTVSRAIRCAVADKRVKAIVLQINSGGGSYVASDHMAREVSLARRAGKTVVAVMGTVAASGGYYLAMNADHIVAMPTTITGSIGVAGGKLVTRDMWREKLSVDWDAVEKAENSMAFSGSRDLTEADSKRMDEMLDTIYEDFTSKAAAARKMSRADMEAAAQGRIWTGVDALRLGLVDEIGGGLAAGVDAAKRLLGLGADSDTVDLVAFPPPQPLAQRLLGGGGTPKNNEERDRRGVATGPAVALPTAVSMLRPFAVAASRVPGGATAASAALAVLSSRDGTATIAPLQSGVV